MSSRSKAHSARRKSAQRTYRLPIAVFAILLVGAAILAGFVFLRGSPPVVGNLPAEISVAEAFQKREAGAFMLDVREPSEWQEYHMPGATLIPLGELAGRVSELPDDREIVVVCRSGNRSATGRDILLDAGLTRVTSMAGGMSEWRAAGYPTVSGN